MLKKNSNAGVFRHYPIFVQWGRPSSILICQLARRIKGGTSSINKKLLSCSSFKWILAVKLSGTQSLPNSIQNPDVYRYSQLHWFRKNWDVVVTKEESHM